MSLFIVTWNCNGKVNETAIGRTMTELREQAKTLLPDEKIEGTIVCLQETSLSNDQEAKEKMNGVYFAGVGTDKVDSGNQKCNTAVYWQSDVFKREGRDTVFHKNRYYECVKLGFHEKTFWVMSVHAPSGGPAKYAANGQMLSDYFYKTALECAPLIAVGDMNCTPKDLAAKGTLANPGAVVSSGKITRPSSRAELDFMAIYGGTATCVGVTEALKGSDHLAVGFLVTPWK